MRIKFKIFFLVSMVTIVGCEDNLQIENPNAPTPDVFFQNTEDAITSVNAVYSRFNNLSISRHLSWLGNLRSDEIRSESPAIQMVNNYDLFAISDYNWHQFSGIWSNLYVLIYRANQTLENVPMIEVDNPEDQEIIERVLGEASFIRGWAYYNLALYWGNVPVLTKPSVPEDKPSSTPQEDVYQQAISDFEFAFERLWTKEDYMQINTDQNLGRATKGAAIAMMGKAYMQLGDYESALDALEWLTEGEGASYYSLVEDYRDNFLSFTENNSESIFENQCKNNPSENHGNDIIRPDQFNHANSSPKFYAPRTDGIGFADLEVNEWVLNEFLEEQTTSGERDPRVAASFLYKDTHVDGPGSTVAYGRTWISRFPNTSSEGHNRISLRKWLNDETQNFENFSSPNNWRILRYADVLLLYAECLNEQNRTNDAYQWVNMVRQRAGLATLEVAHPEIGTNKDLFLEQLKHERVTELAGEGHRWADLARWGDLSPDLQIRDAGFASFETGKHELLPIPQFDLDFNPNLSQNPNW